MGHSPDRITEVIMYSYLFNIYDEGAPDVIVSILLKAKDRFSCYESIFVKVGNGKLEKWEDREQALSKIKDIEVANFFYWLEFQYGMVPYRYIGNERFAPYELYGVVKGSFDYDITVETNEPVEDFGDPGTYFEDMYKKYPPDVDF